MYGVISGYIGIALNIALFALKLIFGVMSGSLSMQADAYNNLMDILSSCIVVFGFKIAAAKEDKEHPYGHGRMEQIAGLIIAIVIVFTGFELGKSSIERISAPQPIASSRELYIILIAAIAAKFLISIFNFALGKRINSETLIINAKDSSSDVIATLAVLVSLIAHDKYGLLIDGWAGLVVSVMILYAGVQACTGTIEALLGEGLSDEEKLKISAFLINQDSIMGVHDISLHRYGAEKSLLTLHAEMDAKLTIEEMHPIIDSIEHEILKRFGYHALIHVEPRNINYNDTQLAVRDTLKEALNRSALNLFYTDFICDPDGKSMKCDVYAPYDLKISNNDVKKMIEDFIKERHDMDVNITINRA